MAGAKLSLDEEEKSARLELLCRVIALGRSNEYISG